MNHSSPRGSSCTEINFFFRGVEHAAARPKFFWGEVFWVLMASKCFVLYFQNTISQHTVVIMTAIWCVRPSKQQIWWFAVLDRLTHCVGHCVRHQKTTEANWDGSHISHVWPLAAFLWGIQATANWEKKKKEKTLEQTQNALAQEDFQTEGGRKMYFLQNGLRRFVELVAQWQIAFPHSPQDVGWGGFRFTTSSFLLCASSPCAN